MLSINTNRARMLSTTLPELKREAQVIDYGAIIICRNGNATFDVDFKQWKVTAGSVITLFPNDMARVQESDDQFVCDMLQYDAGLLREASLNMERTVYSMLKHDRCRTNSPILTDIVTSMMHLLEIYFKQNECLVTDQLVLYQLKAFFLGFYDWISRHKEEFTPQVGSQRHHDLFAMFMDLLGANYMTYHDVATYADKLNITPKYLNNISKTATGIPVKTVIDNYLSLQIKSALRTSNESIKQLAWQFHFSDVSFFCRFFKRQTGMTPQEFRNLQTK